MRTYRHQGTSSYVCWTLDLVLRLVLTLDRFYSWRRYCNKHQIRLGGYIMTNTTNTRSENRLGEPSDGDWEINVSDAEATIQAGASTDPMSANDSQPRKSKTPLDRSPTPPRALFRSTTGKGVAFTTQDRNFLISFMQYRK